MKLSEFQGALGRTLCSTFGVGINPFPFTGAAALFVVLMSGATVMEAQETVGASRPATVPSGYVVTPFGYFHPACVKRVSQGDLLQKDQGTIRHADGSSDPIGVCNYPHYDAQGVVVSDGHGVATSGAQENATTPSISHSWIEAYSATISTWYDGLSAEWTVPALPDSDDGQTLFYFPGMIDSHENLNIIQPVLGWNRDFTNGWSIASWNCCISGYAWESTPIRVSSGDTVYGVMTSACFNRLIACGAYNIETQDQTTGQLTDLSFSKSDGQIYNEAFAGALEVYGVTQCSDYPPNQPTEFYDVSVVNNVNDYISNPGWSFINYSSGLTPQCSYGGSISSPQEVWLYY